MEHYLMNKEQLSGLSDDVRIPTEELRQYLKDTQFLPKTLALSEDGGIAFFWEEEKNGLVMTADLEIYFDGTASASVIPYRKTNEGHITSETEEEPIELWDIEEAPPYEESLRMIQFRLGVTPAEAT